ncbi:MAG TPA: MliC family protein [Candidatus Paceibacterota bacterium]|nr:MliC family protein [Candidatus Paceibacterota bacterium]
MRTKTILIIIAILLIVVSGALYVENRKNHQQSENETLLNQNQTQNNSDISQTEQPDVVARFVCPTGAYIDAKFYNKEPNNSVDITLSDGRNYKLPQVISASGARYANSDESFVFWNKGDMAFTLENDKIALNECYTKSQEDRSTTSTNIVGGDRDAHGCIGSARYSWCAVKNKCLRIWEEKCEVTNSSDAKIILDATNKKVSCESNGGVWYSDNNTCEINSLSETSCIAKGGEFNSCASACRHDPKAEICTMQCVLTCTFK